MSLSSSSIKEQIYNTGDVVTIKCSNKIISCIIDGEPKWRDWTDSGEYDYIYPIKSNGSGYKSICQDRIINKIGSDTVVSSN
tara:strand:+ start:1613 stop:1858 length:246 start_codon:yes stop_codon:yes gene_type:complete